jgi:hypothetical protein
MSVYPTNLLITQLLIVVQDPPRLTQVILTLAKQTHDSVNQPQSFSLGLFEPI